MTSKNVPNSISRSSLPNGVWRLDLKAADGTHLEVTCEILVNGSGVLKSVLSNRKM
jgi:hypothetical protein